MQHTIPVHQLGAEGKVMAHAIEACVHCGFCLAACPTYAVLGEEMDSPRGRIFLMKSALEGSLTVEETLPYIDRCLGCLACVPACPSGVPYGELLPLYRAHAAPHRRRSLVETAAHTLVHETLPYPDRFRLAALTGRMGKPVQGALPGPFQAMLNLLPDELPSAQPLPSLYPAEGRRRARVALLAGCVQQALAPEINWATLRVLAKNGVEVLIPKGQGCCGSLSLHAGELERARTLARRNLRAFPRDVDAVLTNAAGCGSGMKEYGVLFAGQPEAAEAGAFAGRVRDVSEFLSELGLAPPPALREPLVAAYHDACHLAHAQSISAAPRQLLRSIPNLTLVEIPEGEMCCGSAGTYNLEQPELANIFGRRKAANILGTGAQAVVAGNIGCLIQIRTHLQKLGRPRPVYHTLELLDRAYKDGGQGAGGG
ncbi:MAG: heterodisulfide reductase-related iron-sulfur binding cluster [Anaerolineales bacterium]|nr:heterodisulfide reductase-related iron-sulfur binding cluster [Anaerolineales bacterium]